MGGSEVSRHNGGPDYPTATGKMSLASRDQASFESCGTWPHRIVFHQGSDGSANSHRFLVQVVCAVSLEELALRSINFLLHRSSGRRLPLLSQPISSSRIHVMRMCWTPKHALVRRLVGCIEAVTVQTSDAVTREDWNSFPKDCTVTRICR
eukprot:2065684-Amphidinium_carterae.1